tara:strand:+ start:510 stop:848 length:339 start_codon:yes stop_codon:yes gene_type:complete
MHGLRVFGFYMDLTLCSSLLGLTFNSCSYKKYRTLIEWYELTSKKFLEGDDQGVIIDYSKMIEQNPESAAAYSNRGLALEELGDLQGACSDWRTATELGSEHAEEMLEEHCE